VAEPREPRIGDIGEIANAIQLAAANEAKGLGRAVFFIGAGCSRSAGIPLVPEMAQKLVVRLAQARQAPPDARKTADGAYRWLVANKKFGDCCIGEPPKEGPDDRSIDWARVYDLLFADHYKTPDHARKIFSDFVDDAGGRINWAHLSIGELAKQKLVSTVITTNFDQLVLAGMVHSGVLPVVCDSIESLTRIRGQPLHPQLVELHGSRHTYRLRNAPDEVEALLNDAATIAAIETLFQELSVFVVVGYGGRERGVIDLLVRAASRFPDKQIFWVSHGSDPKRLSDKGRALLATSRHSALLVGRDADSFFLQLLKELGVGAPESIREPLYLARLHAQNLEIQDSSEIAEHALITAEISRHRSEIELLEKALARHRAGRTHAESAVAQARELKLAGKLVQAFGLLKATSENSDDSAVWQQLGEVALELGKTSPDRAPLEIAVAAWRRVLAATNRGTNALDWAAQRNTLGDALSEIGQRESNPTLLEEAVSAFRDALEERTRERVPLDWATTQDNLGIALLRLGERESDTARVEESAAAFREALKERTRERAPLDWSRTQNSLGNALLRLGEREIGTTRLEEAIVAFREALEEATRERVPLQWAMIQNNLGNALARLGERTTDQNHLDEAVTAYREALKERTRERVPLHWATTQNNLGNVLTTLGERGAPEYLREAVTAFRESLKERTRERVPLDWAGTQNNLANALSELGERENSVEWLEQAISAYRAALKVADAVGAEYYVKMCQENLTRAIAALADRKRAAQ
jgi:tetratricopeptide (TPR) repeat protein